jgi:hypothetical protein
LFTTSHPANQIPPHIASDILNGIDVVMAYVFNKLATAPYWDGSDQKLVGNGLRENLDIHFKETRYYSDCCDRARTRPFVRVEPTEDTNFDMAFQHVCQLVQSFHNTDCDFQVNPKVIDQDMFDFMFPWIGEYFDEPFEM